jgi:hypothetical protein
MALKGAQTVVQETVSASTKAGIGKVSGSYLGKGGRGEGGEAREGREGGEEGEGRREKGEGRREKGEGRREI